MHQTRKMFTVLLIVFLALWDCEPSQAEQEDTRDDAYVDGGEIDKAIADNIEANRGDLTSSEASAPSDLHASIDRLIEQLGHPDYQQRGTAEKALVAIGVPAMLPLEAAAGNAFAERAHRAKRALEEIRPKLKQLKERYRKSARSAATNDEVNAAGRFYTELLALPHPSISDCREAAGFFERQKQWQRAVEMWVLAADTMQRILDTPVDRFIRRIPASDAFRGPRVPAAQYLWDFDHEWRNAQNVAHARGLLLRRYKEMAAELPELLVKIGCMYRRQVKSPDRAIPYFAGLLDKCPIYHAPIGELLANRWTAYRGEMDYPGLGGSYTERRRSGLLMNELVAAREDAGQIEAAIDIQTRLLLRAFVTCRKGPRDQVEKHMLKLLALAKKRPPETPMPPLLLMNLLDPQDLLITLRLDDPRSVTKAFRGSTYNVTPKPGFAFSKLEITADMEGNGGYGEVNCRFAPYVDRGEGTRTRVVQWYPDLRKGREAIKGMIEVPKGTDMVFIEAHWTNPAFVVIPGRIDEFTIHSIQVRASFQSANEARLGDQPTSETN